jgi:hypothetical protein
MGGFGYILQEYDDPLPLSFNDVIEFSLGRCPDPTFSERPDDLLFVLRDFQYVKGRIGKLDRSYLFLRQTLLVTLAN